MKGARPDRVFLHAKDQGARQIAATIYAKRLARRAARACGPGGTRRQNDVAPADGADVPKHRQVDALACRVALADRPRFLLGLPVDDAGDDERQAAAGVHSLPQLATAVAVENVTRRILVRNSGLDM